MCGIFGLHLKNLTFLKKEEIKKDIKLISHLSRTRGQDTYGISIFNDKTEKIFKQNVDPSKIFKRGDYKRFISKALENLKINNPLSINGQTRLVTNGTKFLAKNNLLLQ